MRGLPPRIGVAVALLSVSVGCVPPQPRANRSQPAAQVQGASIGRTVSRRELESRAAQLERDPRRRGEAAALRARLRDGDFRVGDAIVVDVVNVPQFSDTFPVRAGVVVQLPEVAPIPLSGVLRSELEPHLRRQIGRYVINPTIQAYSLVRVGVAGAVARPGFYELRPDAPVSEAVTAAGGLREYGDAMNMSVRRDGRVIIDQKALRSAVAAGATLDDLAVRPGDEVRVEERVARREWVELARSTAYLVIALTGLWAALR